MKGNCQSKVHFRRSFNRLRKAKENCVQEFLNHFKYNINGICIRLPVKKDNINKHFQEPLEGTSASLLWVIHSTEGPYRPGPGQPEHLCYCPRMGPTSYTQKRYTEWKKATACSASDKKRIQSPFNLKRSESGHPTSRA